LWYTEIPTYFSKGIYFFRGDSLAEQKPLCVKCTFLYTTWDPAFPYGCKAMGIKSARLPWQVVKQSSGEDCLAYTEKPVRGTSIQRK